MTKEKLIVALDFPTLKEAQDCVKKCGDEVCYYKVGMELYYSAGHEILSFLKEHHKKIFLDLKLQDIPNTVGRAMRVLTRLGVDMINVHAVGGLKMMQVAVQSAREEAAALGIDAPKLLAVTVLTSMDEESFAALNYKVPIASQVIALAKLAQEAGLDGVVASAKEATQIRAVCGKDFLIVTPGVRPAGADVQDQSRVTTPAQAIENGADYLVVGRPITQAADAQKAAREIQTQICEGAL